jgi:hypothetical protein
MMVGEKSFSFVEGIDLKGKRRRIRVQPAISDAGLESLLDGTGHKLLSLNHTLGTGWIGWLGEIGTKQRTGRAILLSEC